MAEENKIDMLKQAAEALQESEKLYRSLFEHMLNGFAYCRMLFQDGKPTDFIYLAVNDAFESQTGLKNVVGKKVTEVIPGIMESDAELLEIYGRVALTGKPERFERYVQALAMWFAISVYSPGKEYFVAVFDVITNRKQVEEERKLTIRMMQLMNNRSNLHDLMHGVTDLLKEWTGCDAIGIRLRYDDDFPYFETSGFPSTFIQKENSLCAYGPDGKILRDGSGNPVLECMCGNILSGRFDPAKPFFTEHRSFWSNNTSALLARSTEADRQARTRNRCNSEGYESVALIPLRTHNKVFGLLQINDQRTDRFTPEGIALLENLADNLSIALSQRQTQEELKKSEEQYRSLVNSINIGIFRTSVGGGRYLQVNPALAYMHGYDSVEELLEVQVSDLWQNPEDRKDHIDELRRNGYIRNKEVAFLRKDGTPILCSMTAAAQYDENGNFKWIHGTVEDISERRKLEEQLRQSQKMEAIGTLAGGVAHDFNNILTAIIGFGQLAKERIKKGDEETKKFIDEVLAGAERAAELTHSLLAFSRKQTITLKQVDINDIVRRINRMLVRVIGEDIKLTNVLINRELTVMADRGQVEQVLLNLATNARDAMPDGGELTIQTGMINVDSSYAEAVFFENTGMYAVLTVSDTGIGLDQKTRENIFEPFFTTKEVGKGTGLGLSMVYGIVKQHGGNINVYSEPGKGTTFRIYLPMITATAEEGPEAAQPAHLGSGETILLAEDDPQVRNVTGMYLREYGYTVIEAENGEEAIRGFIENRDTIAIVLLDVIMPVKNGRDAYDEIKKLNPRVKAIFMSGYTDDIISRKGILEKGFDFISKPINPDAMLRKIREVLAR